MHMQSICNVLSVTCFSLSVTTPEIFLQFKKKRWNNFGKHGKWTGKTGIGQNYGNLPGSRRSMHSYTLTYFRLQMEKISQLWVLNIGDLNFCTHSMPPPRQWASKKRHQKEEKIQDISEEKGASQTTKQAVTLATVVGQKAQEKSLNGTYRL